MSAAAPSEGKAWDYRFAGPVPHTTSYYVKCMLGGVLSCGLTHLAVVPLDIVKCNMQVGLSDIMETLVFMFVNADEPQGLHWTVAWIQDARCH